MDNKNIIHSYKGFDKEYNFGFYVYSDYCDWPACEVFFVKSRNAVKIIELK